MPEYIYIMRKIARLNQQYRRLKKLKGDDMQIENPLTPLPIDKKVWIVKYYEENSETLKNIFLVGSDLKDKFIKKLEENNQRRRFHVEAIVGRYYFVQVKLGKTSNIGPYPTYEKAKSSKKATDEKEFHATLPIYRSLPPIHSYYELTFTCPFCGIKQSTEIDSDIHTCSECHSTFHVARAG